MKNLVLKDIRSFGLFHIFIILLALGAGYIGSSYSSILVSSLIYAIPVLTAAFVFMITITDKEANSGSQPLFASMPVTKFDIVKSRYLGILCYIVFISGVIFLSSYISIVLFNRTNGATFMLIPMILILSISLLTLSLFFPIQFYDSKKAQMYNWLFIILLILFPKILDALGVGSFSEGTVQNILNANYKTISPVLLIISLVIYTMSLFVSRSIYLNKEF